MHPIRKKGRGGGGGKASAPHPDELIGVSPTTEESHKPLPGLRTRKTVETVESPLEGAYGSSNLAAAVLRSFQREKEERQSSFNVRAGNKSVDESSDESTPKVGEVVEQKSLPQVPHKKIVRSVSRGKKMSSSKEEKQALSSCGKEGKQVFRSGDEKRNQRRSVSAQPMRECRHREPFDCSSKVDPSLGIREVHRGVAKAFLKSSTMKQAAGDSFQARKTEAIARGLMKSVASARVGTDELKQQAAEDVKEVTSKPSAETVYSNALHERLALLEEKVTQLATELRGTKELLHANNPLNNQVLSDIQLKISNIEKVIVSGAAACEGSSQETRSSVSALEHTDTERRKSIITSKEVPQLAVLKDKPSLHQKLLESRAALQQKIVENRVLLKSKIAALDGPDNGNNESEVITAEFLASLKQAQVLENNRQEMVQSFMAGAVVPSKFMDAISSPPKKCSPVVSAPTSEKKRRFDDDGVLCSSGSYKSAYTSASDVVLETVESLQCDEAFEEEAKENAAPGDALDVPVEDVEPHLCDVGSKAAMAGWFVYEAEGLLLAHEDGSCSFHDVANMEEKSQYKSPKGLAPAIWRDCWLIRAAGVDGRSCKYVVAASAGTAVDPAFCSWNFYEKTVAAYHSETLSWPATPSTSYSKKSSPSLSPDSRLLDARDTLGTRSELDFPLWWYRPCGPLIASGGSGLKTVSLYDIRDGDLVMKWESDRCMAATMGYNSPIQWRGKSSLVIAEDGGISMWDVSSSEAQCVNSVDLAGKNIRALHIYNSDGECNGGVRQRISSNDSCGIDGVFATEEALNVLDFRVPSGVGLKLSTLGKSVDSLYACGDAVYAGLTGPDYQCSVQLWSLSKGEASMMYTVPYSAASHHLQSEISQVWGNDDYVMAVNGNGLFVFDAKASGAGSGLPRAVIGSDDLYCPSFDYSGSKLLLVSRDRPASWQYWPTSHSWSF